MKKQVGDKARLKRRIARLKAYVEPLEYVAAAAQWFVDADFGCDFPEASRAQNSLKLAFELLNEAKP